jgi:hypothetical protein
MRTDLRLVHLWEQDQRQGQPVHWSTVGARRARPQPDRNAHEAHHDASGSTHNRFNLTEMNP